MDEAKISFDAGGLTIEGLLGGDVSGGAVVITHPHPLYGGEMHNGVVDAVVRACRQKGLATLRFNFRGVGQSQGHYDEGIGEQDDVRAAVSYLDELGAPAIDLAGYSFGAWVNASAIGSLASVNRLIMVSPPVNFMDFSFLNIPPNSVS
ncbi:MAG: alpha/beta hydrolase [Deltaproteobacteria bacterium]|nr:alpha/beta hydrolase [Deltaproteobacteria bacterium]